MDPPFELVAPKPRILGAAKADAYDPKKYFRLNITR